MDLGPDDIPAPDEVEIDEPPYGKIVHTAADRTRLAMSAVAMLVAIALAAADRTSSGFEEDILLLFGHLPDSAAALLVGGVQVIAAVAPAVNVVVLVVRGQLRLLAQVMAAVVLAWIGMLVVEGILDRPPVDLLPAIDEQRYLAGTDFPSGTYLAAATAMLVVMSPWLTRRLRRFMEAVLVGLALARVASATTVAWDVLLAVTLGAFCGMVLLAVAGSPNRRPHGREVLAGLGRAGIGVRTLRAVAQRGSRVTAYLADTVDGRRLRVELASPEDHEASLFVRLWRWVRLHDRGRAWPFASLRRTVEHEALVSTLAASGGVRTPRLVAVGEAGRGGQLLTFDDVEGTTLAELGPDDLSDDVLRAAWGQVAALRRARVAHRDLLLEDLLLDDEGQVWVTDFSSAEPAPESSVLSGDVAQLLCDTALMVGPKRSAGTAVEVLGHQVVAEALPRLQRLALSGSTRRSLRHRPGLLVELRAAVQEATGVNEVQYEDLERLKPKTVLGMVMVALAIYVLLPQLSDLGGVWDEVQQADWAWFAAALLATAVTFVGAAIAIVGSVPNRVRFVPALGAQLASSFVNKVTPANVGGIALNARFLQKNGVDTAVAVTGVGLNTVAGLAVHLSFLVVVAVWVGRADQATSFSLPFGRTVGLVGVALMTAAVLAMLVPSTRRLAGERLLPALRRSRVALRQLVSRPAKIAALLGGSAMVTVAYFVALACSLQAFGGGQPMASLALVYLAGTALASAAPTPGGLGAVEAALVAGLSGIGVRPEVAVSAVLTYRLLTFWLPVIPGYLSFVIMQRRLEL